MNSTGETPVTAAVRHWRPVTLVLLAAVLAVYGRPRASGAVLRLGPRGRRMAPRLLDPRLRRLHGRRLLPRQPRGRLCHDAGGRGAGLVAAGLARRCAGARGARAHGRQRGVQGRGGPPATSGSGSLGVPLRELPERPHPPRHAHLRTGVAPRRAEADPALPPATCCWPPSSSGPCSSAYPASTSNATGPATSSARTSSASRCSSSWRGCGPRSRPFALSLSKGCPRSRGRAHSEKTACPANALLLRLGHRGLWLRVWRVQRRHDLLGARRLRDAHAGGSRMGPVARLPAAARRRHRHDAPRHHRGPVGGHEERPSHPRAWRASCCSARRCST